MFWGVCFLGLKDWGFWGVFPNARGGGPVGVVREPVVFVVWRSHNVGRVVLVFLW